jgi:bidirectional [NiFe] hydrogenase diaphorase subunit
MVKITIDGRKVEAKQGSTILENTQALHIQIPTLCYHRDLSPYGACRLCVVEVKDNGKWKVAASCETVVMPGMEIKTGSEKIKESRKLAAELLYYKFPTTEAVRDMAKKLGVAVTDGKADDHDCILCSLCTRTCHEIVGADALKFLDRGPGRNVENPKIEFLSDACIGCGSCAFVCPTGFVRMEAAGDTRTIWDKTFKMAACSVCGRFFAPEDQLKWISKKTGVPMDALMTCTSCK